MLLFWLACGQDQKEDTDIMQRPNDTGVVEDTGSLLPEDIDQDGFTSDVDCDDWNPLIFPGAVESPDDEDNDCDGFIDWDGVFQGTVDLTATAIYEGVPYDFEQFCTVVIDRIWRNATIDLTCQIDQSQVNADLLLGGTLTLTANGNGIIARTWSGDGEMVSTGGEMSWDADGSLGLNWSELSDDGGSEVEFGFQMDTVSLDMHVYGSAQRL